MDRSAAEMRPPAEDSATATVWPRATRRSATGAARDASRSGTGPRIPRHCRVPVPGQESEHRRQLRLGAHLDEVLLEPRHVILGDEGGDQHAEQSLVLPDDEAEA